MSEYLIQSETLDDIADAINAKTGKSAAMTPAEMVTEIGSIQTGGSYPPPISAIATGSFTLAEDVTSYAITHGLGVTPRLVYVWCNGFDRDQKDRNPSSAMLIVIASNTKNTNVVNWLETLRVVASSGNLFNINISVTEGDINSATVTVRTNTSYPMRANFTNASGTTTADWRWVAVAF